MERRRVLQGLGAMGLAAFARTTHSGEATDSGALCTTGDGSSRPLYVPRDAGFLGRLAPRGAPLTIVAGPAGALPARVAHGPFAYRVRHDGRDFVNPSLILRRGERVRIALENRLSEPTIAHWHGLSVDTINDGSGLTAIAPREKYAYDFEVRDRGALYWYHPHPHGATARQTYQGLFGAIEVEDDDDRALRASLDLVPGRTEIALTLQDRRADPSYTPSQSDLTHGFFGDDLLVNGTHCPFLDIGSRLYRFRVLNACNARTLRLAFRTAAGTRVPFIVIGNDGGLLPAALRTDEAFLAAAERLDVLLDLRDAAVGDTVVLESLAFDPMHAEVAPAPAVDHTAMGHTVAPPDASSTAPPHVHGGGWPEGAARAILALRVRTRITYDRALSTVLPALAPLDVADALSGRFAWATTRGAGGSTTACSRWARHRSKSRAIRRRFGCCATTTRACRTQCICTAFISRCSSARPRPSSFTRSPSTIAAVLFPTSDERTRCSCGPAKASASRFGSRCPSQARRRTCSTATISSMKMAA
jgi:suppressor of ftsI/bilirubin oxidase